MSNLEEDLAELLAYSQGGYALSRESAGRLHKEFGLLVDEVKEYEERVGSDEEN